MSAAAPCTLHIVWQHACIRREMLVLCLQAFDMYATNPLEGNAYGGIPPAKPTPQWKELQTARQRIGLMLVAHAKAQPQALLPHLAALANKTQELWAAGVIGTNEQSTLFDVVLAAASGADLQLQKQVGLHARQPITAWPLLMQCMSIDTCKSCAISTCLSSSQRCWITTNS